MYDNMHIQTIATDFSRNREREPSNLGTFVRLNVLDYKRGEQVIKEAEVVEAALSQDKFLLYP